MMTVLGYVTFAKLVKYVRVNNRATCLLLPVALVLTGTWKPAVWGWYLVLFLFVFKPISPTRISKDLTFLFYDIPGLCVVVSGPQGIKCFELTPIHIFDCHPNPLHSDFTIVLAGESTVCTLQLLTIYSLELRLLLRMCRRFEVSSSRDRQGCVILSTVFIFCVYVLFMSEENVRYVINLCREYKGPLDEYEKHGIEQLYLPVSDGNCPSLEQLNKVS